MSSSFTLIFQFLLFIFHILYAPPPDLLIYTDDMDDSTAHMWTYGGAAYIPSFSTECTLGMTYCFELDKDGWVEKTFTTKGYHSVYFTLFLHGWKSGTVDIKVYNDDILISDTGKTFEIIESKKTVKPPQDNEWDNIDLFVIRFGMDEFNTVYMDRLQLMGIYDQHITIPPTVLPSTIPTVYPSEVPTSNPTMIPTANPTMIPTTAPTNQPTSNPTNIPTMIPTSTPTRYPVSISTFPPNIHTTINPTNNPSMHPSTTPTKQRTIFVTQASSGNEHDVDKESITSTVITNSNGDDSQNNNAILSDGYLLTHWYYLAGGVAIVVCLICTIAIYYSMYKNKKLLNHLKKQSTQETMIQSSNGVTNMEIEMQKIDIGHEEPTSIPSTHIIMAHSPSQPVFPIVATQNGLEQIENGNIQQHTVHKNGEMYTEQYDDKNTSLDGLGKMNYDQKQPSEDDDDGMYGSGTDSQQEMQEDFIETKGQTMGGITAGANGVSVPEDTDTDEGSEQMDISDDNIGHDMDIVQNENATQQ